MLPFFFASCFGITADRKLNGTPLLLKASNFCLVILPNTFYTPDSAILDKKQGIVKVSLFELEQAPLVPLVSAKHLSLGNLFLGFIILYFFNFKSSKGI